MSNAPFYEMLVYLDGSEGSICALMYAIQMARSTGAQLHAVYVVNSKALGDLVKSRIFIDQERNEYMADLKADAERHLRHARKLAAQKGIEIETEELEGAPHAVVMDYIKKHSIDMLVLGPVNEIRSRREELTAENDRMLRTCPCPVLVVKDSDDIWRMFEEDF